MSWSVIGRQRGHIFFLGLQCIIRPRAWMSKGTILKNNRRLELFKRTLYINIYIYIYIYIYISCTSSSSSSSSSRADSRSFPDSLAIHPYVHRFQKVLQIAFSVPTKLMNVSLCLSINTGVSPRGSPSENVVYELVFTSPEIPSVFWLSYLDSLWDEM